MDIYTFQIGNQYGCIYIYICLAELHMSYINLGIPCGKETWKFFYDHKNVTVAFSEACMYSMVFKRSS